MFVDGEILGKPNDDADAARMLRLLSGRTHQVITGVCLMSPKLRAGSRKRKRKFEDVRSETTLVTMDPLTEEQIASMSRPASRWTKPAPMPFRAVASRWISRIEGDYFNVVGLPVSLVFRMLQEGRCLER